MSAAAAALRAADLRLGRVATAADALGLPSHVLLHAGPPLREPTQPPAPLRRSALATARHQGWARDDEQAAAMLREGALQLRPAQAWRCVTPLAAVVSASTPLFGVCDGDDPQTTAWAPVSTVGGPDLRFGRRDAGLPARLAHRDHHLAPALAAWLQRRGPLPLWPLAVAALQAGDDLHSRTTAATALLAQDEALPQAVRDEIGSSPLFFLTVWMAACACLLARLEGADEPGWVCRAGGNGETFGIALAGDPARWHTVPATPPVGSRMTGASTTTPVLPAIGDSALIDMAGFGGQRLALAPEPAGVLGPWAGPVSAEAARALLAVPHPRLPDRWPVGLDAVRVATLRRAPWVALALVGADDGDEGAGLLGRGVYRPPVALFSRALAAVGGG